MKVKIEIRCDNAAFEEPNGIELARIFKGLADAVIDDHVTKDFGKRIVDLNGNVVGEMKVTR